jgi:hypothetical protein
VQNGKQLLLPGVQLDSVFVELELKRHSFQSDDNIDLTPDYMHVNTLGQRIGSEACKEQILVSILACSQG